MNQTRALSFVVAVTLAVAYWLWAPMWSAVPLLCALFAWVLVTRRLTPALLVGICALVIASAERDFLGPDSWAGLILSETALCGAVAGAYVLRGAVHTRGRNGVAHSAGGALERHVRIVRDPADLSAAREGWLGLQRDQIAADPDYFAAGFGTDPKIVRPHVLMLERNGALEGMLVGRIEALELGARIGSRTIYSREVRSLTIVYGGILVDDDEAFRLLLKGVERSLESREADVAILRYLPLDSSFYRIASDGQEFLSRRHFSKPESHWEIELPASFDELAESAPPATSKLLTQHFRKLLREFGDRLEVRTFREPGDLDRFFREVEAVATKTYQRALGVAFGDTAAHRARTRVGMERGWFRGYVLYVAGRPVAFEYGELYRGRYRGGRPGYDPAFTPYRVGAFLGNRVLADVCDDTEARVFDYGVGDAEFKRALGTRSWQEANVILFAPTVRARTISLAHTMLAAAAGVAAAVVGRTRLPETLKRRRRRRFQSS